MHLSGFIEYKIAENQEIDVSKLKTDYPIVISKQKINADEEIFLSKIFSAINLKLNTSNIITNGSNAVLKFIPKSKKQKPIVFSFGLSPLELNLNSSLQINRMYSYENFDLLLTNSLEDLMNNQEYKKGLWIQLKNHFNK